MKKLLLLSLIATSSLPMNPIRKLVSKLAPKQQKTKDNMKVLAGAIVWGATGFWAVNKDLKIQKGK